MYVWAIDYYSKGAYRVKRVVAYTAEEALKKARLNKSVVAINIDDNYRVCSKCGKIIQEGFVDDDKYYCEDCLPYSDDEWEKLCDEYYDQCYWTQWD